MSETVDSLKQRLVGAFVIISLAIIFLPMIFDKPHQEGKNLLVPVPPKPEFKTIEIAKPVQPRFKVLEVDPATNKVVEGDEYAELDENLLSGKAKRDAIDSNDQHVSVVYGTKDNERNTEKATVTKIEDTDSKRKLLPVPKNKTSNNADKKVVAKKQQSVSKPKVSKPKVSHLPVFKNVWMVQLGTFSKTQNAYNLRDKLRADGFDGHTKEVILGGKKAIKVFTGPFVKKREAQRTKKKLDDKYKIDSRVIFFDA